MFRLHRTLFISSTLAAIALAGCMSAKAPAPDEAVFSGGDDATEAMPVEEQEEPLTPPVESPIRVTAAVGPTGGVVQERAVDTSSTSSDTTLSKDVLSRISTGRSYQSAVSTAAGVSQKGGNKSLGGGATNENTYALDGDVKTTMPVRAKNAPLMARPAPNPTPVVTEGGYQDYGVNGYELAAADHLSTFAIDVDTASYTMARKNLNGNYLPPSGSVRVEEFVNYFPYEYNRPAGQDPFGVDFEAAPSPWDDALTVVRIGVQGKTVTYAERKPVHLTFLVDTSGSMRSRDKLELVKESLLMLSQELEDGDTVAVATYAGSTRVVLEPTPVNDRQAIESALLGLTASGSTAMSSGIDLAYQLADARFAPGTVNRVIICSDGDANVGQTRGEALANQIKGYAKKGITLTTLGFGNGNYKDTTMEVLANKGDGNYFYIDTQREAQRVLVDKLSGTLEVIAKDVKIQVDWNPEVVHAYRLIGYENRNIADRDFRNDAVDAGEIGAGHQVTALYEVATRPGADGKLATVHVRNKAPGADAPAVEREWTMSLADVLPAFSETSRQYRIASSAAYFADILRGSKHMAEISLTQIAELAEDAERPEYSEDRELVGLIRKAAELRGEGQISRR